MKKLTLVLGIVLILGSLLFINTRVSALTLIESSDSLLSAAGGLAERVATLERQVAELFDQIAHIQLTPGPQGPVGPVGPQGPAGTPSWDEARIVALEARVTALENPPLPPTCTAVLCENFNSYLNGAIVGQGNWLDRDNGSFWINQDSVTQEGIKALFNNYNNNGQFESASVIQKFGTASLADGKQSFYVRTQNRNNWGDERPDNVQVGVYQGGNDGPAKATVSFRKDGTVTYINGASDTRVTFDTYIDNAWNLVEIEWRAIDKTARYRVNNGTWTNWIPFTGGTSFTGFNSVVLTTWWLGTGGVYIDNLH